MACEFLTSNVSELYTDTFDPGMEKIGLILPVLV